MTPINTLIKDTYGFDISNETLSLLQKWQEMFLEYNSKTNLMSKNDTSFLIEKHLIDSLAISLFEGFTGGVKVLDVGTGGGFPSLILSIIFPDVQVIALDSILKKTRFIELVKEELNLSNLTVLTGRAEDFPSLSVDILTSRAVGKIEEVWRYSKHHLKKGGYFVSYKALTSKDEAKAVMNKFSELKNPKFISYKLPLKENFTRELVIFKR